jgi:hypothetical protein
MRCFARPVVLATTCLAGLALIGMKVGDPPAVQMQTFATSLLSTLDEGQKAKAVMEFDSPDRVDWHFIPKKSRKGLMLKEMTTAQRTATLRLVRSALSEAGYDKTTKIMLLEDVLRELEGDKRNWDRDPGMYYLTLFGNPEVDDASWGLSFEGHHLSLNFVCRGDEVVDSTPQFFAANPATIMTDVSGPLGKGTRVLRVEEDLAFELINAMDDEDRQTAMIAEEAPAEIRFAGDPQAEAGKPEGVGFSSLASQQQSILKDLVGVYVDAVAPKVADQRRKRIEENGWDEVHFAWAGATKPGIGHYYRVQGEDFLIEFVNTQPDASGNPANHIHAVWRDLTGDFDLPNE